MPSPKYGWLHQQLRIAYLRALIPGTPCRRCGQPRWHWQALDLGHGTDGHTGYALEHRSCNRQAGARNGYQASRQRTCKVCGAQFLTTWPKQTRCSKHGRSIPAAKSIPPSNSRRW